MIQLHYYPSTAAMVPHIVLEEIGIEGRARFREAGGKEFHVIPCLNEHPRWITALAEIAFRNLAGWLSAPPDVDARDLTQVRAKALGAAQ